MLDIEPEELERIIQTLAEAIRMHDHWRDNLFRALIAKYAPTRRSLPTTSIIVVLLVIASKATPTKSCARLPHLKNSESSVFNHQSHYVS